jgi:hypothetical protein
MQSSFLDIEAGRRRSDSIEGRGAAWSSSTGLIPEEAPAAPSFLFWLERETSREPHMTTV